MKENRHVSLLYLRDRISHVLIYFVFAFIFFTVFYLYHLPLGAILYGNILCMTLGLIISSYDFYKYHAKHKQMSNIKNNIAVTATNLPSAKTLEQEDYQNLILTLHEDKKALISQADEKHGNLLEYYTLWTHQIKTPLSAANLLLQSRDQDMYEDLETQILEIEKYVDMALQYLRIDSISSDLKLEEYTLEKIIKSAIKAYSKLFIYKNLKLNLEVKNLKVITDEKWLLFVIKQILSNALKYTNKGEISIYVENERVLVIQDTGIGIGKEDIPRLCERGFTGYNGRMNKKSTGLGLYLSKQVLDKLGHKIMIVSEINKGTKVKIDLSSQKLEIE